MNKNELRYRRVAWEIIKKSTYRDRRLSDVTAEIFRLEGNSINDHERRLITMLVQGTVRMSGRLDWEIRQVFVGEYEDLKVNLRILLRMGVFQLHYMDSIPDYAAVATTVQLAKSSGLTVNGLFDVSTTAATSSNSSTMLKSNPLLSPAGLGTGEESPQRRCEKLWISRSAHLSSGMH